MLLLVLLPVLLLTAPLPSQAAQCDYSGFDQPCKVNGGIYRVVIPEGEGPFPVMVYLYGSGGHSISIANNPIFMETVVDRGYALIVPAALDMTYRGGVSDTGWALRNEPTQVRDEVAYLRRVIDDVGGRFDIDRGRILFVGQSRGGFLLWEIACHNPELGSAFAIHAAGYLGVPPQRCKRPVRLLHTHGQVDPIVPMNGRRVFSGGAYLPPLSDSMDLIARSNGCGQPGPEAWTEFYGFERKSWPGCPTGGDLTLMLHPGGHGMPWIWFRAVLDWFEEAPTATAAATPVTRMLGAERPAGRFKGIPAPGAKALSGE